MCKIQKIGTIAGECSEDPNDIYALFWKNKVIPFRHTDNLLLGNLDFPIYSSYIQDIGKDLSKISHHPRDHRVSYDITIFKSEHHSYDFSSEQEYKECLSIIKEEFPKTLKDQAIILEVVTDNVGQNFGSFYRTVFFLYEKLQKNTEYTEKQLENTQQTRQKLGKVIHPQNSAPHMQNFMRFQKKAKILLRKSWSINPNIEAVIDFIRTNYRNAEYNTTSWRLFFCYLNKHKSPFVEIINEQKQKLDEEILQKAAKQALVDV